ncbi:hypothetical protein P3W85_11605, partial [Cupriavidus basilensis]
MTLASRCCDALAALCSSLLWAAGAQATAAAPAPGSLSYIAEAGRHPWTGRLLALALPSGEQGAAQAMPMPAWEAGALLDARDPDSRRLFSAQEAPDGMPPYLVTLRWETLDTSTRDLLAQASDDGRPDDQGRQRLARLRGAWPAANQPVHLSPTAPGRLGRPAGTPPVLVPPPIWIPGRPGHAEFAVQHSARRALVWLGTHDGMLHAFDASSGEEILAYLPRGLLKESAAWSSRALRSSAAPAAQAAEATPPAAPCPYPEAADVALEPGRWRTVLLCGFPTSIPDPARPAVQRAPAGVFVLDITDTAAQPPLGLLWEAQASDALPLAPAGPVRALALATAKGQRWYAMVALAAAHGGQRQSGKAHDTRPGHRAGLALLPLDKPAHAPWQGRHAVPRLQLPASGCGTATSSPALLAATVLPDFAGAALAAYAVDAVGRLWRFDLHGDPPWHDSDNRVRCIHRAESQTPSPPRATPPTGAPAAPAPVIVSAPGGHLVVYGGGNHITAVFDHATLASASESGSQPRRISAQAREGGVVLRRQPCAPDCLGMAGWHLPLPNPGERLDRILAADTGYLGLVTRTPDARQRIYLVHALSGESIAR